MTRAATERCSIKIGVIKNFAKFSGKHLCRDLFFNKVAGLKPGTLLKKRLRHSCFPGNFAKFLRTAFLKNTLGDWFWNDKNQMKFFLPMTQLFFDWKINDWSWKNMRKPLIKKSCLAKLESEHYSKIFADFRFAILKAFMYRKDLNWVYIINVLCIFN